MGSADNCSVVLFLPRINVAFIVAMPLVPEQMIHALHERSLACPRPSMDKDNLRRWACLVCYAAEGLQETLLFFVSPVQLFGAKR
jgi:hypothetical protein